jgi:hypothetical protein
VESALVFVMPRFLTVSRIHFTEKCSRKSDGPRRRREHVTSDDHQLLHDRLARIERRLDHLLYALVIGSCVLAMLIWLL